MGDKHDDHDGGGKEIYQSVLGLAHIARKPEAPILTVGTTPVPLHLCGGSPRSLKVRALHHEGCVTLPRQERAVRSVAVEDHLGYSLHNLERISLDGDTENPNELKGIDRYMTSLHKVNGAFSSGKPELHSQNCNGPGTNLNLVSFPYVRASGGAGAWL